jgi:hypothetical protein
MQRGMEIGGGWEREPRAEMEGIDVLMLLMGSLLCMMACYARCARRQ